MNNEHQYYGFYGLLKKIIYFCNKNHLNS